MKRYFFALLPALLISCGAESHAVRSPDGWPQYAVSCRRSIENCWEEGWAVCPRGYDVIDRGANFSVVPTPNGPVGGERHTLLVRCR